MVLPATTKRKDNTDLYHVSSLHSIADILHIVSVVMLQIVFVNINSYRFYAFGTFLKPSDQFASFLDSID